MNDNKNSTNNNGDKSLGLMPKDNSLNLFDDTKLFLQKLANLDAIAEVIAKSETYSKVFKVAKKDAEGKIMEDEEGNIIEEVSKSDIICCIGLGKEMGLDIFGALSFGKALNADSYKKVIRGKALGLDPIASLNMVSIIPTKNGDIIHTGVHVITNALNKANIRYEVIKDFSPIRLYYVVDSKSLLVTDIYIKEEEYNEAPDNYLLLSSNTTTEQIKNAQDLGTCIIKPPIMSRITTILFQRNNYPDLNISYTLQEAIDAGLYKGVSSKGDKVTGKDNWNSNPATMLRNRTLTIGGRIIGSDIIHNTYSTEEAYAIKGGNPPKDISYNFDAEDAKVD